MSGVSPAQAKEIFDTLDANGDGVLVLADLRTALKGVCSNDDEMKEFIKVGGDYFGECIQSALTSSNLENAGKTL